MNDNITMKDFLREIDNSFKHINEGDLVNGTVISMNKEGAIVNLGVMYDGLLPKDQITNKKEFNIDEELKVGDKVSGVVLKYNDGEGHIIISKKRAEEILAWDNLLEIYEKNDEIKVVVKEETRGGVIAQIFGLRAFIPASQLSRNYVNALSDFIGKELRVRIIELNKEKRKIILSSRVVEEEEMNKIVEKQWKEIKVGELKKGIVTKIMKFGAFVKIDEIEGLIHINDLSWKRVNRVEDVVSVGDIVQVYVRSIDIVSRRLGLSLKDTIQDPWESKLENISIGKIIEGTITKFAKFGAFVEVYDGIEGLVHINEICDDNISKPEERLKIGEKVKVKVMDINKENRRLSLSIKEGIESNKEYEKYNDNDELTLSDIFAEKLKGFKFD